MLESQKKLSNVFYSILSLPSTAMGFALCIQISALSWILKTKYNLNLDEIGFVWAAGPLAGILGQPIVGLISDKVWFWGGRRRPFILGGSVLAALAMFALPNIDKINSFLGIGSLVAVALVVALTLDLAINISFNPTRAIIADVTPDGNPRTKGYTWMQTISGLFGVGAYFIGAVFGNYFLIFSGVAIVLIFSIVPIFFIQEPRELAVEEKAAGNEKAEPHKTKWPDLFKIYFAHGFSWVGIQVMFVYIIGFITQKIFMVQDVNAKLDPAIQDHIGQVISIAFLVLNAMGFILPALVLEPISEKIGRVRTHIIAVSIMAVGYFGIVFFGHSATILYLLMAVCGIGWGAVVSLPFAIMSEKVDKNRMGFFMGIFNLSVVIPQLIASLFLGKVIQANFDKGTVFIISGTALAISAVLWLLVKDESTAKGKAAKLMPSGH